MKSLKVIRGDITLATVCVVVNAAMPSLLGGGGVDGAIHEAAGPDLWEACRKLGWSGRGEVAVTPAFNMPCRYIIHTVGPIWRGGVEGEPEVLSRCYRYCLTCAKQLDCGSIAFPCIGTGSYGYPKGPAADIALASIAASETELDVELYVFSEEDEDIYNNRIARREMK